MMGSKWGADGTDGTDPHNRIIRETPGMGARYRKCSFCGSSFESSDLAHATRSNVPSKVIETLENDLKGTPNPLICRKCRGLKSRNVERKQKEARRRKRLDKLLERIEAAIGCGDLGEVKKVLKLARKENDKSVEKPRELLEGYCSNLETEINNQKIETALKSSDFKTLFKFFIDDYSNQYNLSDMLIGHLENLRLEKSSQFDELAYMINASAKRLGNLGEPSNGLVLEEFFHTLFSTYPESIEIVKSGFTHWFDEHGGTILRAIRKLDSEEFRLLIDLLPPPKMGVLAFRQLVELLILYDSPNKETADMLIETARLISAKEGDALLSYVIRKRNQSNDIAVTHNADLLRQISCIDPRIVCLLSMGPQEFSNNVSREDFDTIIKSPLYSLILSSAQIEYVMNGKTGEIYRAQIKQAIDKIPLNSNIFLSSISRKFSKSLGREIGSSSSHEDYTLAPFRVEDWDLNDERSLDFHGDKIVGKASDWDSFPLDSTLKENNPFKIAKLIIEYDFSFSEEVRTHLDSVFLKFS